MEEKEIEKIFNGLFKLFDSGSKLKMLEILFSSPQPIKLEDLEERMKKYYTEGMDFFGDLSDMQEGGYIDRLPTHNAHNGSPCYRLTPDGIEIAYTNSLIIEKFITPLVEEKFNKIKRGEGSYHELFSDNVLEKEFRDILR